MAKGKGKSPRRDHRRQYAALPWRRTDDGLQILLVTSRETRRWIIPKGWPMKDRLSHQAAAQEAFEEAGVEGDITDQPLGLFRYHKRLKGGRMQPCTVDVFPLAVVDTLDEWPEMRERERVWVSVAEAVRRVEEPELKALIEAFAVLSAH